MLSIHSPSSVGRRALPPHAHRLTGFALAAVAQYQADNVGVQCSSAWREIQVSVRVDFHGAQQDKLAFVHRTIDLQALSLARGCGLAAPHPTVETVRDHLGAELGDIEGGRADYTVPPLDWCAIATD